MKKTSIMTTKDFDFIGPNGEIVHLEDVASIRSVVLNNLVEDTYFVDFIDLTGVSRQNYLCTFKCLNYAMLMIFVEGDKEDKTQVTISFDSLMSLLTKSRNLGYSEGAKDEDESYSSDEAMEELMKRDVNTLLN